MNPIPDRGKQRQEYLKHKGQGAKISEGIEERSEGGWFRLLRAVARMAVLAGVVGSIGLMLWVGHRNHSLLLMLLFTLWVPSPFVTLGVIDGASKHWSVLNRAMLSCLMLVLTLISLILYSEVAITAPKKPAFVFLMVPLTSWLLIALVVTFAMFLSGRRSSQG